LGDVNDPYSDIPEFTNVATADSVEEDNKLSNNVDVGCSIPEDDICKIVDVDSIPEIVTDVIMNELLSDENKLEDMFGMVDTDVTLCLLLLITSFELLLS
jgi:hypothetical protein